jgi:hypothetical protein
VSGLGDGFVRNRIAAALSYVEAARDTYREHPGEAEALVDRATAKTLLELAEEEIAEALKALQPQVASSGQAVLRARQGAGSFDREEEKHVKTAR